jgi:hypothetical protein
MRGSPLLGAVPPIIAEPCLLGVLSCLSRFQFRLRAARYERGQKKANGQRSCPAIILTAALAVSRRTLLRTCALARVDLQN